MAAQIHLALNHLPIAGVFFGLMFLAWGIFKGSRGAKLAGLGLFVVTGLLVVPVFLSGDGAEEIVEHKPGVTEGIIHEHEEAAEMAFYVTLAAAVTGLVGFVLLRKQMRMAKAATLGTFGLGLVSIVLLANAAHLGGMIRHDEIRPSSVGANSDTKKESHDKD
jgi:FtsH-binding integral membrane protein